MGFGTKWVNWMHNFISSAALAILVNGSPTAFFDMHKGLRQGDLLSPLLFNICVNGLFCILNQLLGEFKFSGVRIGPELALNHVHFADDTLLFCENNEEQLNLLCNTLLSFLFASGLKLNFSKSTLIGINMDEVEVQFSASTYGWRVGHLPITYLGVPLGGNPCRISFWEPMLCNFRNKRRSWNSKYISLSGRLSLRRFVLSPFTSCQFLKHLLVLLVKWKRS